MLPPTRQRLVIAGMVVVSMLVWVGAGGWLATPDRSSGISMSSASGGWFGAMVAAAAGCAASALLGAVASATGHRLAGPFAVAMGLCVLAGRGGPIDGWMRRVTLPGAYGWLIVETVLWHVMLGAAAVWMMRTGPAMRPRIPSIVRTPLTDAGEDRASWPAALGAAVVAVIVAGVIVMILQRSTDVGQVIGVLILAFTAGAVAGQSTFPANRRSLPILLSPAVVAIAAYAYVLVMYGREESVLAAWYNLDGLDPRQPRLPGPAVVLPIYYASAGVMGAAMGLGMADVLRRKQSETSAAAAPQAVGS